MKDGGKIIAPTVEQKINVTISGEDKLQAFARTLNRMASGTNLQDYWKSQKALIEDVTRAFENYQAASTKGNAEELVKLVNALKAVSTEDLSSLFKNFGDMSPVIEQAKRAASQVSQIFSVDTFKEAFSSFDMLKAQGLEMEEVFKRFSTSADVSQLRNAVDELTQKLRYANVELQNAKRETRAAKEELDSFTSGNGMQNLIDQAQQYEQELESIRNRMQNEFLQFLQGNGLGEWNADSFSHLNNIVEQLFENISDGSMTSQEAIARVKGEFYELIDVQEQGLFNATQVQEFTERLDQVCQEIDQISVKLDSLLSGGALASATQALSESERLTEQQRAAMAGLSGEAGNLQSVVTVLAELVRAGTSAEGEVRDVYQSLNEALSVLRNIGNVDVNSIESVSHVLGSIGKLNELGVDRTSADNIDRLTGSINALRDAEETYDHVRSKTDGNERERLASLERAYNLLTKLETAQKNWTAAQEGKSGSSYKTLADDVKTLQDILAEFRGNQDAFITLDKDHYNAVLTTLSEIKARHAEITNAVKANDEATQASSKKAVAGLIQRRDALASYVAEMQRVQQATPERAARTDEIIQDYQRLSAEISAVATSGNATKEVLDNLSSRMDVLEPLVKSTANVKVQLQDFTRQVNEVDRAIRKLGKGNSDTETTKITELTTQVTNLKMQLQDLKDAMNKPGSMDALTPATSSGIASQISDMKSAVDEILRVRGELQSTADAMDNVSKSESEAAQATSEWAAQMETLRTIAKSLETAFKSSISGTKMLENADDVNRIKSEYADLVQQIKEADSAEIETIKTLQEKCIELQRVITAKQQEQAESKRAASSERADQGKLVEGTKAYNDELTKISSKISEIRKMKSWTAAVHGRSSEDYAKLDGYIARYEELREKIVQGGYSAEQCAADMSVLNNEVKASANAMRDAGENTSSWSQRIGKLSEKFATWFSITRVIMAAIRTVRQMVDNVIDLDSAMTQLQIVTGASDTQMTKFLTSSVSLAKELGQSVTDVLGSIETFSRLGYNLQDASKLAEYAGILSNVASVSTDEATTGLTSIIKGYNMEVQNAEHVADVLIEVGQKYAVSASEMMEAYEKTGAALSATNTSFEKSAGLIAAANASVQNASTVGTALKTVSARIRGAKTELKELGEETEELAEGFSKYAAEIKALTGFDILVEGTTDTYKDIYDIFEGIAQVWDKLSDTSQSRVAEILGGTRQFQIIASIIGNWEDAANAYADAMNAAGVATDANARYMESLAGKIGQFKATFQELSNTLISSDFVGDFVELGTTLLKITNSIAKVIDSIGGLNTVLYVTLGIIATIKAESIISFLGKLLTPLKSLITVIEAVNAGAIATNVSGSGLGKTFSVAFGQITLSATAAQLAVGGLVAALGVGILLYNNYKKSQEEQRMAAIESADAASELSDEIISLTDQYLELSEAVKTDNSVKEELLSTQDELINKLGIEKGKLQELTDEYGNLADAIKAAAIEKLKIAERDIRGGENQYEKDLLKAGSADWGIDSISISGSKMNGLFSTSAQTRQEQTIAYKALKALEDAGFISSSSYSSFTGDNGEKYSQGFAFFAGMDEDLETIEGILNTYEELGKMLDVVTEAAGSNNFVFDALYKTYNSMTPAINSYHDSISQLNKNLAEQYMLQSLIGKQVPSTQSEFDAYRQSVIDAAVASGKFVGTSDDIANSVDSVLQSQTQFADFYNRAVSDTSKGADVYRASLGSLADTVTALKSSYDLLEKAEKEMAGGNGLSPETIKSLADSEKNYLDYLYEENGVVKLNTEAWKENANAKMRGEIEDIEREIESLERLNDVLRESSRIVNVGKMDASVDDNILAQLKELGEGGAVDVTIRPIIDTSELRAAGWDEGGDFATIFTSTFSNEDCTVAINFTPIIVDENGNYIGTLSQSELQEYAEGVIAGTRADDLHLQIGAEFTGDDAIEQATQAAIRIHELHNQAIEKQGDAFGNATEQVVNNTVEIERNNQAIAASQAKLAVYKSLYGSITGDLDAYTSALQNFSNVANSIDSVSGSFQTLANLQAEVAKGYTISLNKALEYAAVYPQILNSAQATADGQIALNEDVVNSFIQGKEAELNAQIDAEISKLESDKAVLNAKMESAMAQLELAKNVGEGEGKISKEAAEYRINLGNALTAALIQMGVDEATAYALATAAMADDEEEFARVAKECFQNMDDNAAKAAYNMAHAIFVNANNSCKSIADIADQAHEAAKAIAAMGNGEIAGSSGNKFNGSDGTHSGGLSLDLYHGDFKGSEYDYDAHTINLDDYIAQIELDISAYEDAIAQIDGQIAALEALRNLPLNSFKSNTGGSKGGGGGKGGGDSKVKEVEEYIASIDKFRDAVERLRKAQARVADLELQISDATSYEQKIELQEQLIDAYREEQDALLALNKLRAGTIDLDRKASIMDAHANSEVLKQLQELGDGGTVDVTVRPIIDTSELRAAGWDEEGGFATILTSTFSNEDGTVAVNFTPIIVDENGKYVGVLTPSELQAYAEGVIAGTRDDDLNLQVGAVFTGENAIDDAVDAAITIHNLHEQIIDDMDAEANAISGVTGSISAGVQALRSLGFAVEYNAETNELWISNLEHLNELTADNKGKYDTMQEATNALRKETEDLINTITTLNDANREGAEKWKEVEKNIRATTIATYENRQSLMENRMKNLKHMFTQSVNNGDLEAARSYAAQINEIYSQMMQNAHEEAEAYRAQDYTEESDEIVGLRDAWYSFYDDKQSYAEEAAKKIRDKAVQPILEAIAELDDLISQEELKFTISVDAGDISGFKSAAAAQITYLLEQIRKTEELLAKYRSEGLTDASDEIKEAIKNLDGYNDKISQIKDSVVTALTEMVNVAHDALDEIQNVSDSLYKAAQEYADNGGWIAIDTYQQLLKLGPQYMQMLENENGELVINEERINAVIAARTRQLALEQAITYVERIKSAALGESNENLDALCTVTEAATNATWGLVYAEMEAMRLSGLLNDTQYGAAMHNIQAIQSLAETAVAGIGHEAGEAAKAAEEAAKAAIEAAKAELNAEKEALEATKSALEDSKDALEDLKDELDDLQDGCDDLVKYVMEMLKSKIKQQIQALNDAKTAVKNYVTELKNAMRAQKENIKYEDEVAAKLKAIAKLQSRIDALSLDDSRKAQAEKMKLEEELADLQKDLADYQSDHALDVTEETLDKQYDAYEKEKDDEIAKLEESISSTQKLYDMAIQYIREHWNTLYNELIEWNTEYGTRLNSEITKAWEAAQQAASRYGDFVTAVTGGISNEIDGITAKINDLTAQIASVSTQISNVNSQISSIGNTGTGTGTGTNAGTNGGATQRPTVVSPSVSTPTYSESDMLSAKRSTISGIVSKMRNMAVQWHTADKAEQERMAAEGLRLGASLAPLGVTAERDNNGVWWIKSDDLNASNVGKKLYEVYHTGGFVGEEPLRPNEKYIKVENGELVLTDRQQDSFAEQVERLGAIVDAATGSILDAAIAPSGHAADVLSGISSLAGSENNVTNNNQPVFHIEEHITCVPEQSINAHKELDRSLMNQISRKLRGM